MTQTAKNISKNQNNIRETLIRLGAISEKQIEVFSTHTRDNSNLTVFRDKLTKVIFIDDYFVGDEEYKSGKYRNESKPNSSVIGINFEDLTDSERRFNKYRQFIVSKSIVDFGCGAGSFLRLSNPLANNAIGVELQQNYVEALKKDNINCYSDIEQIENNQDSVFMFHCLEHMPNQISILRNIYSKLKANGDGKIIVEVPHAKDFLIDKLAVQSFIDFTLWSQHLVLHTRESLYLLLTDVGFKNIQIEGVQRYNLSNHINWLKNNKPGGHKESLSIIETDSLVSAYSDALSKIDANDTLVAIAQT